MFLFCLFSVRRTPSLFVIPKVGMLKRSGGPRTYALHHIYTLPYLTLSYPYMYLLPWLLSTSQPASAKEGSKCKYYGSEKGLAIYIYLKHFE